MRRIRVFIALATTAISAAAAGSPEGRWTGVARVPDRPLTLVVDLAKDSAGAWIGSLTIPGLDVNGASLGSISVTGNDVLFDSGGALGVPPDGPATFRGRLEGDTLAGELRQAGNAAPFTLKRIGDAQVDLTTRSKPVADSTQGRWVGEYEMGGYPRQVTVDIANEGLATPRVDFVVVGKATTKLPIDFVAEQDGVLRIESRPYRITFEGRVAADRIVGSIEAGPVEVPLVLRRSVEKTS
ncbi:MAG TPA: hypothetical protein VH301_12895 [Usitatibacter sp.]|nr:hypothetical protein [Usitatibacter sp.]